ncbi:protein sidekick-2-like [Asterias amurensis]|uniref:protein sidekick-2-like n=1 Tax=Asterias amurensis TaxID=7602 RepID=UPI003AB8A42E
MYKVRNDTTVSVGAFKWTYGSNEVKTIRMRSTATLLPIFVTRTVNLNDNVSLIVKQKTPDGHIQRSRWRKDGGDVIKQSTFNFDINNANTNDSGVYECHYQQRRGEGNQALLRLIVRGCPKNKHGPPDCRGECPICLNGGICDDVGGDCICPPGFGGRLCERIKGPNSFGRHESLRCDAVGLPHDGSTCKGMLFCSPDPYGCSCAAGYQGLECKTGCDDGTYGANCAQICHCVKGVSCDGTTGVCNGDCAAGYKGVNCQVQCTSGEFGEHCAHTCHCADGVSCDGTTGRCDGDCAAEYKGVNCQDCIEGKFGVNCDQNCHCADSASCDGTTGQCDGDCAAGYKGDNCQVQCTSGEFGENCAHTCHCADGVSCDGTTGQCDGDCAAEYKGDNCQVCIEGKFGASCAHICHCADGVSCDGTTGQCIGDCAAGYIGDICQEQCLSYGDKLSCSTTCTILDPNMIPQRLNVSSYSADDSFTHTLSWEPVMCPSNNFSIVNYVYEVLDGHGSEVEPVEVEYTYVNLNLSICTSYQFKVAARTSKGVGNNSFVFYTTISKVPNPVTNITVSSIIDTQLTISWAVPVTDAQGHCPAIDYLVTYDLINLEQCQMVNRRIDTLNTMATTITIDGLEAYSTYRVNVTSRNQAGSSTAFTSTTRTEESRPEAPIVTVNSTSTDYIEFAWELPCGKTGGIITMYKYQYRKANNREQFNSPIPTTDKLGRISSLTPCTLYEFNVRASTSIGEGPWSVTRHSTTKQAPLHVKDLDIQPKYHDKLVVSWQARQNEPCPATGYIVTYELIRFDQCREGDRSGGSVLVTDTFITIPGLQAHSEYRINVTSRNEAGNGTTQTSSSNTGEISFRVAPRFQNSTVSASSINITWNPIPCGSRGVRITGYRADLSHLGQSRTSQSLDVLTTSVQFDRLSPCTSYTITVTTLSGGGITSFDHAERTKTIVPGVVTGLTIKSKANGQLIVTWTAPSSNRDNHCPATAYELTYELINLEQCQEGNHSGGSLNTSDTTLCVDGLYPYSTYRINVTARNKAGNGPTISKSAITTERSLGIAPSFNSSRVTSSSINITWNPIPCGRRGVNITGYRVDLTRAGQSQASQSQNVSNMSISAQFDRLSPCTSYNISVSTSSRGGATSFNHMEKTKSVVPDRVTALTFNHIQHDQLGVTWIAPANRDNPCLAIDYLVTYELINLEQCQKVDHAGILSLNTSDTSVIIEGLEAYSTYRVNVTSRNEAGFGSSKARSKITGERSPQAAPTFNESEVTASSISITWNPIPCDSRGGSIPGYISKLFLRGNAQSQDDVIGESTSVQFDELSPCTTYTIVVTTLGTGEGTSFEREETTYTIAPGRVTVLRANPTSGATQIHVTWQNPNANNCPISKYTVEYQLTNRDQCDSEVTHNREQWLDGSLSPTTIAGLYPHSTYIVYVTPSNSAGAGGKASAIVITNDTAPSGPPRDVESTVITNQTIAFSWKQPACGQRNGVITQYHYRLIDSEGVFEEDTTSSTGVEFTSLVPFTSYTLSVSAHNQFASGPVASYTTRTKQGIPPPPSKVTFPVTRSDRITVAWNAPSPPHGIIISYDLRYWKTGSGNQTLGDRIRITKQLASQYQTKTIMALDKSISYSIQIRAETSVGHGPWSDISTVTTVPKVPTPPSNVTFPVIRSDRITVSWLRPSQGDSISYEIRYWRTGSGNSSSAEIVRVKDNQQTDLQTREITNLEGNVSYSFQVWCQVNHRYVLKHILDLEDGATSHYL